jgi:hypothetical protein
MQSVSVTLDFTPRIATCSLCAIHGVVWGFEQVEVTTKDRDGLLCWQVHYATYIDNCKCNLLGGNMSHLG